MGFEVLFYNLLDGVVTIVNFVGIIIVFWGFIVASISFIHLKLQRRNTTFFLAEAHKIRAVLATYILLGLEFMIAGDIIHTFIRPTQQDLIILATIVGIRTVISYFLTQEIKKNNK